MVINTVDMFQFTDKRSWPFLILLLLELFSKGAQSASSRAEINRHLELGRDLLARGQLADALTHYHAAVEGDPSNYLTCFKRGTVYLALGKARLAISDFSRVLELKPDFSAARIQRGTVFLKLGDYDNAEIDFQNALHDDPNNQDAQYLLSRIGPARNQEEQTKEIIDQGNYATAIVLLTQLLEVSPWSTNLRESRANCYIKEEDILSAVSDLRSVNRLSQDSTAGYYRLSTLLYQMGHASDALKEIRECLKLDPEHGDCFPFYKKIKKIDKALSDSQNYLEANAFGDCISSAEKVLKMEQEIPMIIFSANQLLCTCYRKDEEYTKAISKCGDAIKLHNDPSVLCDRAEAYLETEMFDDAIKDFQAAIEIDESLKRAKDGIERARKLQKQAERRDYYKILGVKKTATKQEIVKAYRKAAQKWHPDAYQGDEKKVAEKKFIDIAAAKEVLTDPEKRRRFDLGDDPLDPEANQGFQRGNPFHHFQQHGSPFQFKFHFN
ncbi:DnaJ like subfamily C member 3 [Pseudolycoriella hygida]|uniref:DnaJ like subfamily C member 3 n=1 Tax=Pseudolycoriella hygida TaxID=35572 RepID=A0A9Q0MK97_9DIPT|nr:DnaJ like subfamily C member 3 [Pseudolycoriella hygida]